MARFLYTVIQMVSTAKILISTAVAVETDFDFYSHVAVETRNWL